MLRIEHEKLGKKNENDVLNRNIRYHHVGSCWTNSPASCILDYTHEREWRIAPNFILINRFIDLPTKDCNIQFNSILGMSTRYFSIKLVVYLSDCKHGES